MKKLVCVSAMLTMLMSLHLFASEIVDGITWKYNIINGQAHIIQDGVAKNVAGTITIPSTLGGCPVVHIDDYAFQNCWKMTRVCMPDTITSIGYDAFLGCSALQSIELSPKLAYIGGGAFGYCSKLSFVWIPASVQSIGNDAFKDCSNLSSLYFCGTPPEGLATASITKNVPITYPSSYQTEWESVIAQCGFTDAKGGSCNRAYGPYTTTANELTWTYLLVYDGGACVGDEEEDGDGAVPTSTIGAIKIPSTLNGWSVTSIGDYAFEGCRKITSVTMTDCVKTIGEEAFHMCEALTNIVISASVTYIGDDAFNGCSQLLHIVFEGAPPENIQNASIKQDAIVQYDAYYYEEWVSAIEQCGFTNAQMIPPINGRRYTKTINGLEWTYSILSGNAIVGSDYYSDVRAVPTSTSGTVTIPSLFSGCTVTGIGKCAFSGCSGLTGIVIPNGVTSIGYQSFYGCSGLSSIIIPNSVTHIEGYAFYGCSGLTDVVIPNSVTSIGGDTFRDCSGLTSVTIPSSVTNISTCAFYGCNELSSILIPSSVKNIGSCAFSQCKVLKNFIVAGENPCYASINGLLVTKDGSSIVAGINGNVIIPSGVTRIGDNAFSGCSGLTNVAIPNSVTNIATWAFAFCTELSTVTIPASVVSIGQCAFNFCDKLSNVDFEGAPPNGLANAQLKKDAVIRYNADFADEWASIIATVGFTNASSYILPKPDGGPYAESVEGVEWTFSVSDGKSKVDSVQKNIAGVVAIPETLGVRSVTRIERSAFQGCKNMTGVEIPSSVNSIGDSAFYDCSNLKSVVIPSGVTSIDQYTFYGCAELSSVVIPQGVTNIGEGAFSCCGKLTSVTIPSSVMRIGENAFLCCSSLADVYFEGCTCPSFDAGDGNKFSTCGWDLIMHVPSAWAGRGKTLFGYTVVRDGEDLGMQTVHLSVTNVIVHYIQTSEQSPMTAPISADVGIVNVITEIKGGSVPVPNSWMANYPTFAEKFGSDFSLALTKKTGKKDAAGNDMTVWQDFVAGTDPTDEESVFKASVTMVDGVPVVSYTPKLSDEEKAKRKYTTLGKVKLQDKDWVEVQSGHEADYNFFKVTVEMR